MPPGVQACSVACLYSPQVFPTRVNRTCQLDTFLTFAACVKKFILEITLITFFWYCPDLMCKRGTWEFFRSHSEDIQQYKFQSENFMWHSSWNPVIKPYCLSTISCVTQSFCSCCCAMGRQCQVVAWISVTVSTAAAAVKPQL